MSRDLDRREFDDPTFHHLQERQDKGISAANPVEDGTPPQLASQPQYSYETVRGLVDWRDERIASLEAENATTGGGVLLALELDALDNVIAFCREKTVGYGGWYEENAVALGAVEGLRARLAVASRVQVASDPAQDSRRSNSSNTSTD